MLCLHRKPGESIVMETSDGLIEITVLSISKDGRFRLGISAPRHINIRRAELPAITRGQPDDREAKGAA